MCGITGIYHFDGRGAASFESLERMLGVLLHRGPDETGIYRDDHVGLGHARLSIIDLCSGIQPIHNEDETLWIVYNGEVFNYVELRRELQARGHRFYTTSDTEVLLHLYEEKGAESLRELNGQFAFAIWDSRKKELFLARDRIGIRPLHYTVGNGRLIFASEIKSLLTVEGVPREIDPLAMEEIFTLWTTLPGRTAFRGIRELPPGHYLKVCDGRVTVEQYWDIPLYPREEYTSLSPDETCERIRDLLLDAVRLRMRADVPVGTYLSGGLDSSGITSLVVKNFNSDVRTFGIRFEEQEFDEGTYQNEMVEYLGANHSEILAGNSTIGSSLPEVLWHTEKPVLRTAPVPLYLLSGLVHSQGLKVVLTGEGADEVFGGYNIFREAKVREFWARQPESKVRPELIGRLYPYIFGDPKLKRTLQSFFSQGLDAVHDPLFTHLVRWRNTGKAKTFFSRDLRNGIGDYDVYEQVNAMLPPSYEGWDCVSKAQYLEMRIFLSNYLLSSQGDRMAMAHSVEIRLPYLDPNVMEFMGHVPPKWKILGLNEKFILKEAFRGILPESITGRPKHPYRAPIRQSLLSGSGAEPLREYLSDEAIRKAGLFDAQKTGKLVKKLLTTEGSSETENMALIGILSSQIVVKHFIDDFASHEVKKDVRPMVYDRCSMRDAGGGD